MDLREKLAAFYKKHIPQAKLVGKRLVGPCPLCSEEDSLGRGEIIVQLDPDSLFMAYFWCSNRCSPGGFAPHFGRKLGLDPKEVNLSRMADMADRLIDSMLGPDD